MTSGQFTITLLKAELYRDTEIFGAMDPYVVIKSGSQKFMSAICYKGGQHPTWIDSFNFRGDELHLIDFEVWDHEMIKSDDLIGTGKFPMSMLDKATLKFVGNIPLEYQGQPAGALKLMVTLKPDAGSKTGEKVVEKKADKTGVTTGEKTDKVGVVEKPGEKSGKENILEQPKKVFCPTCNNTGQTMMKGQVVPCSNCQVPQGFQGHCSKCFGTGFNQKKGKPCKCQGKNKPAPQFVPQQGMPAQNPMKQQGYPGQQQQGYPGQQQQGYPGMKPF